MFDYDASLGYWINRTAITLRHALRERLAAQGIALTAEEWSLLMVLWRDGPRGMGELAGLTLRDRTTVTRLVDRMVAKDLLHRETPPEDRRAVRVALTPAGMALQEPVLAVVNALLTQATQGMDPQMLGAARAAMQQMVGNLDA